MVPRPTRVRRARHEQLPSERTTLTHLRFSTLDRRILMQFQDTFFMKVIAEFLGTALPVILGNGAVANVHLKGSKGFASAGS